MIKKLGQTKVLEGVLDKLEDRKKYVKKEFQAYGLMLAKELNEWEKRSMYIKLAKNTPRHLLERAFYFVKDQPKGKIDNKGKLFMWKLKQLKDGKENEQEKDQS